MNVYVAAKYELRLRIQWAPTDADVVPALDRIAR